MAMKIYIDAMGLPDLNNVLGKCKEFEFVGMMVADLIVSLVDHYGNTIADVLLDGNGGLNPGIQIFLNRKVLVSRKKLDQQRLQDEDHILFMLLMGGG